MYDNSEQLVVEEKVEHRDKYFSPPLQFILPENISSSTPDGAGCLTLRESFLM
jgi:hypothetical protein